MDRSFSSSTKTVVPALISTGQHPGLSVTSSSCRRALTPRQAAVLAVAADASEIVVEGQLVERVPISPIRQPAPSRSPPVAADDDAQSPSSTERIAASLSECPCLGPSEAGCRGRGGAVALGGYPHAARPCTARPTRASRTVWRCSLAPAKAMLSTTVAACQVSADSGPTRSLNPAQADHRFRFNPITNSGRTRSPVPVPSRSLFRGGRNRSGRLV